MRGLQLPRGERAEGTPLCCPCSQYEQQESRYVRRCTLPLKSSNKSEHHCYTCDTHSLPCLKVLPGVHSAAVSLETGIATVLVLAADQFEAATERLPRVVESVQQLGFEAEPYFGDD